jgi:ABC-2 type transport system permease protein
MILALVVPLLLVLFFGFVIEIDDKNIKIAVQDNDNTQMSRRFSDIFKSSQYFKVGKINSQIQSEYDLSKNDTPVLLIIQNGFEQNIVRLNTAKVQLLLNGSDNAKSTSVAGYLSGIVDMANKIYSQDLNIEYQPQDIIRTRFLFNSKLNSKWFIVPGLTTIIIGLIAIILMSLTIAKEWENGSMELLLSTPVQPIEIIFGKLIPYFILNMFSILLVFVMALLVFGLPFKGSFFVYIIACIIYVCGALALGVSISVMTRKQQTAIQFVFAIGVLPSFLFSGFIFSIENMPAFFRHLTAIFPQR